MNHNISFGDPITVKNPVDNIDTGLLEEIVDLQGIPNGAYHLLKNGTDMNYHSTKNIHITPKKNKPGIDITVKPDTTNETVYIPAIVTKSGIHERVYNDFEIGENSNITIVAGCGIHNCGNDDSEHSGVHHFHLCKGAKVKYVEKHYGEGEGTGKRILNPVTVVDMDENSYCEMETVQIRGVDSTLRNTTANVGKNSKIVITEKLLTHGTQAAQSDMEVHLKGDHSSAQIVSRTVGQDSSVQIFNPRVIGEAPCTAHIQCDSIIMGNSHIRSIPEIAADHPDAVLVHEAAIGKIAGDQILKLMTLGLTKEEAEEKLLQCFLK